MNVVIMKEESVFGKESTLVIEENFKEKYQTDMAKHKRQVIFLCSC